MWVEPDAFARVGNAQSCKDRLVVMDVVKFQGQDYTSLRKRAQSSGKLFEDPFFSASRSSIWHSSEGEASHEFEVVWKRPKVYI